MPTLENGIMKAIATGLVAAVLVTASLFAAEAAPAAKVAVHTKAPVAKKAADIKKIALAKKKAAAHFKAPVAKKAVLKAQLEQPTVLDEIVIEKAPIKVGAAGTTFRKHFYRGQA